MSRVDLHIHTTASDGQFSPAEVVSMAAARGLSVIAVTDHDTINGIESALEAAQSFPALRVIPGIEVSTDIPAGEAHILGYFINHTDAELQAALEKMRNSRRERARKMVARLADIGCVIEWERVLEIAGSATVGRPHIAQVLIENGCIDSFKDAFTRYIGRDGPAYVERDKMTPVQAVELILQAKGLPVLAHPLTVPDPEAMIIELKAAGLMGVEVYYKDYSEEDIQVLLKLSSRYDLVGTGGTDYHGLDPENEIDIGGTDVPMECVEQLVSLVQERSLRAAGS